MVETGTTSIHGPSPAGLSFRLGLGGPLACGALQPGIFQVRTASLCSGTPRTLHRSTPDGRFSQVPTA